MKKIHPEQSTEEMRSPRKLSDIEKVENAEFFHPNKDTAVAFIVIVYKDGTRVTRLIDEEGSLLEIAGDIRDTKQKIATALNGIEFYTGRVETN